MALLRAAVRDRCALVAQNLLLRQQLAVSTRPTRRRPRLRARDKLLRQPARLARGGRRRHPFVVAPETAVRWHRQGWRLLWRWRSRTRIGRPRLSPDVQGRIATMARDDPGRGAGRIRGGLLTLGIAAGKRSVRRYRGRGPARSPNQSGRTSPRNHRPSIWAVELLTVQTPTCRTLYVLVFISHARRGLAHLNVTAGPTAAGVWRQLTAATPWGRPPRYRVRDRDAVYGGGFVERSRGLGTETLLTPVRAPRASAVAERLVGTLRRACLDQLVVLNAAHLRSVLTEFARYYNPERPHRSLALQTPVPAVRAPAGPIRASSIRGGPHHVYERAA